MPVGRLQAVHELLQRACQPFGLIRWPGRHRRGCFTDALLWRHANPRYRRIQSNHARPPWRPKVDGLASPASSFGKMQGRAGNRERGEHDHQQCECVIDPDNHGR